MGSVRVKINKAGMRSVLVGPGAVATCDRIGAKVEASANLMVSPDAMSNPAFARSTKAGLNRARCIVATANTHGARANSKNNVLLKSLEGA